MTGSIWPSFWNIPSCCKKHIILFTKPFTMVTGLSDIITFHRDGHASGVGMGRSLARKEGSKATQPCGASSCEIQHASESTGQRREDRQARDTRTDRCMSRSHCPLHARSRDLVPSRVPPPAQERVGRHPQGGTIAQLLSATPAAGMTNTR